MKKWSSRTEGLVFLALIVLLCCALFPFVNDLTGIGNAVDSSGSSGKYGKNSRYSKKKERKSGGKDAKPLYYNVEGKTVETFDFDPNTADSTQLLRLGLAPWQVRNIYRYRAKGGRYREPDDFASLYGLTVEDFERLRPHIKIVPQRMASEVYGKKKKEGENGNRADEMGNFRSGHPHNSEKSARSTGCNYQRKLREGERIDINKADTNQLKMVPGIGSYYASKIVKARERLGGFATLSQIGEVEGVPEEAAKYMFIGSDADIAKLNINTMTIEQLYKHPYIRYVQAKEIVQIRRLKGRFLSVKDLSRVSSFTENDIRRLAPYIVF